MLSDENENDGSPEQEGPTAEALLGGFAALANEYGVVCLEKFNCPCGYSSLVAHDFDEIVLCVYCKRRMASAAPRKSVEGEVTLEHLAASIAHLKELYENALKETLEPTIEVKFTDLTDTMRLIINRTATKLVVTAFNQAEKLAMTIASGGKS